MKQINYEVSGRRYKVRAMKIGAALWFHVNGETWILDDKPKAKKTGGGSAKADASTGTIVAPMPGKIIKVNVAVNDSVTAKQILILMEAMKMEYSLAAPMDGIVKDISCRVGDQVELNQTLARIEKKA